MTNNTNWLITLIFVLSVLTIMHIAYYLLRFAKITKPVTATPSQTTTKLMGNTPKASVTTDATKTATTTPNPKDTDKNVFYTQSDNFQKVEGIGPAIEETLKTAGIRTFKQLADSDYSTLKSILMSKGSKFVMHDPRNWPKQAKLANEGKWEELDKLKVELIRGK
jgi:predicted flap endonuclease-1-like 5' DNA nuclease